MQLVIMIIHDSDHMNSILVKMMEAGIKGGSLIDCEGALQAIGRASSDPPPVFGSLREYLNPESAAKNKLLLCAMEDEKVAVAKQIANEVTGGLSKPNTGVMFCLPLLSHAPRLHFLRENGRKLGGKIWEEPSAFDSISRSISL